jgi:hypothetical protein
MDGHRLNWLKSSKMILAYATLLRRKEKGRSRMTIVDDWWPQMYLLVRRRVLFRRYGQRCINTSSQHREQLGPLSELRYVMSCEDGQQWLPHQTP